MYNTIQCSPRFRLLTKLCLPAEEPKNSLLGLTSSSQAEVTREMAVTSEGKASKETISLRLPEDKVWWMSVLLSAAALCSPRLGSEEKVTGQHRIKNGIGYHAFTFFAFTIKVLPLPAPYCLLLWPELALFPHWIKQKTWHPVNLCAWARKDFQALLF